MKYYEYSSRLELNPEKVKKYIVESDNQNDVFKLCFDETQMADFFAVTEAHCAFHLGVSEYYIGEDGFWYEFKPDASIVKSKQCTDKMINQLWNSRLKLAKRIHKDKEYSDSIIAKYTNKVNFVSKSVSGFDKYIFINSDSNYVIPFRFKKAKSDNAPLLIYFHGAGCIGYDNFKPLFEYRNFLTGQSIPDCNILIPQAFHGSNNLNSNIKSYVSNCADLINILLDEYLIDGNRVYCFGTSFGGCCVWYSISMFPEIFAAAVPVMGIMFHFKEFLPTLKENNTLPIWIAHSSNDNNVSIVFDDLIYDELKDINPNIKYTRWDKYGHKMAGRFYKKEPFIKWMFNQSKNNQC